MFRKVRDISKSSIDTIKNPEKAKFRVAYEIFASPERKKLVYLDKTISDLEKRSALFFLPPSEQATTSLEAAELAKKDTIQSIQERVPQPKDILKNLKVSTEKYMYNKLKNYFEDKVKELGLKDPLIFYEDKALRIDIGYGPKEFSALFPNFTGYFGEFRKRLNKDFSAFETSNESDDLFSSLTDFARKTLDDDYPFLQTQNLPYSYLQQDYQLSLETEQARILETATKEFANPRPPKKKLALQEVNDEAVLINKCLQQNQGLVIGECHEDKSPKQFLIDNMVQLKSQGVTTLYMEHLLHEFHQSLLDVYFTTPDEAPMPKTLELYLKHLDKEWKLNSGPASFFNVVKAAKENGIRIVAIDTEATYQMGIRKRFCDLYDKKLLRDRYKAMNMAMLERFAEYNDGGKFVALIGSGHVSTIKGTPGVSNLLGCPGIVIHDLEKNQLEEKIETNIQYTAMNETMNFDVLYHRNPETKIKDKPAYKPNGPKSF